MGYVIRFCQTNSVNCVGGAFLRHGIVRRDSRRNVSFLLPAFKRITARDKGTAIRRRFTRKKRICAAIISKDNYAMIGFIQKASRRKFELLGLLEIPSKYVKMITKQYYMGPEIKGYFKNWKVKHSKEYIRIQNQENDEFYSEQEELDSNDEIYGTDQNSETSENLKDRDQWITYEIGEKDGENDIIVVDDEKSGSSDCEIIETDDSDNETLFDKFNLQVRTKELFESRPQPPAKRTYQKREGKVITVEDLTCTTCNKVFNHLSTLKNHIKKHLPFEFICHICELEFSRKAQLDLHMQNTHIAPGVRNFHCDLCGNSYQSKHTVNLHMNKHLGTYKCKDCGKCCQGKAALKMHNYTHVKARPLQCHLCNSKFKHSKLLNSHYSFVHMEAKLYDCDQCDKKYKTARILTKHKMFVHIGHRNHHCDQCEKSFKCATMLANHIACLHSDLRPFKCKICPSTFKLKTSLDKHNKGHLMSFRFECLQCDKCYKSKHSLNQHIFIKHTMDPSYQPNSCNTCGKKYKRRHALNKHKRTHLIDNVELKCEICFKIFKCPKSMKYHKIVHSDKKDLPCPMCDKMFKTKNSVQKHLKTHDESENLPCTVEGCQFILRNKIALVRHLLVHSNKEYACEVCDKICKNTVALKNHTYLYHSILKRYSCSVEGCKQAFKVQYQLRHHIAVFHSDKQYICDKCGNSYKLRGSIIKHLSNHIDKEQNIIHKCSFCHKSYQHRTSYRAHIKRCEFPKEKKPRNNSTKPKP